VERLAARGFARMMDRPRRYRTLHRIARWATRLFARKRNTHLSALPPPFNAWTRTRDFPSFPRRSFRELWTRRRERGESTRDKGPARQ
jgi:L-lactate dehydrogenase complex protein LldF